MTLCDPMDCRTPGFPVHHQFPEPTQTHVHRASDAIQPPHPLSSPSPPAFNLSQHQGLFEGVSSLHHVANRFTKPRRRDHSIIEKHQTTKGKTKKKKESTKKKYKSNWKTRFKVAINTYLSLHINYFKC